MPPPDPLDRERLARLLGGETLAGLRRRLRKRYARTDPPGEAFTLDRLTPAERDTLAGLLGRPRGAAASMRLSHRTIDEALQRARLAPDLRTALECLDGPISDLAFQRERERRAWAALVAQLPAAGPLAQTLARPADQGLVKRLAHNDVQRAADILAQAQRVLARLPAPGTTRSRLAADVLGDAHGLDPGRAVATLLQRALDPERRLARRRDLWAAQGVMVNELAKPVATLNLAATGAGAVDSLLATARRAGEPLHLSLRQLLRAAPAWRRGQPVYVCENPDVLAGAADGLGAACPAMVSLDGQLSAAPRILLDQLHTADCRFYYHGDFDWPGLAIANGIVKRYAAIPWRYAAADYAPTQGIALRGEPVDAIWDPKLSPRMRTAGLAVHEEAQLALLLQDLRDAGSIIVSDPVGGPAP